MRYVLIPVIVGVLAGGLALGVWLGTRTEVSDDQPVAVVVPSPPVDPTITFDDLLERARPDVDGNVAMTVTATELTTAANNELPPDAPVDRVQLKLLSADDDRPTVDFTAKLPDGGVEITGAVALEILDGRVEPTLVDVKAGSLSLPGALRGPVEDLLGEARTFFAELHRRGATVTDIDTTDGTLRIVGRAEATPAARSSAAGS